MRQEYDFEQIAELTHLVPFRKQFKISEFDSGIEEYNDFLMEYAELYQERSISRTHLLLDNESGDVVGYISLSTAAIKLTTDEKDRHGMDEIPFNSIPVLRIGKLAVDRRYRERLKGYGSFLIQLARGFAAELNENGVACKFVLVDADVQYNEKTIQFYIKNGFLINESFRRREGQRTISMRLDIMDPIQEMEQTGT